MFSKNTFFFFLAATLPIFTYGQAFEDSYYGEGYSSFATGDFDGDKQSDVIGIQFGEPLDEIYFLKNEYASGGKLTQKTKLSTVDIQSNMLVFDYDKDGDNDIVVATGSNKKLTALLNNGSGTFTAKDLNISNVTNLSQSDIDGDGDIDIFCINKIDKSIMQLTNTNGTYKSEKIGDFTTEEYLFSNEVNHDPAVKLIAVRKGISKVNFDQFTSTPSGLVKSSFDISLTDNDLNQILMADINRDGTNDLILAGENAINLTRFDKIKDLRQL